jgi:hypothetical protein
MALLSSRRARPLAAPTGSPWPIERPELDDVARAALARLSRLGTLPAYLFGERGFQSSGDDVASFVEAPDALRTVGLRVGGDIEPFLARPPRLYCDPNRLSSRLRSSADYRAVSLLIRQTARYPIAALSDGSAFRNSILAGFEDAEFPAELLLAYLNSSPIRWLHYLMHRDARQGMPQVKIGHLRAVVAPPASATAARDDLARMGARVGARNRGIQRAEQVELDRLVADLLGLRECERERIARWTSDLEGKC